MVIVEMQGVDMQAKYTKAELRHMVLHNTIGPDIKGIQEYLETRLYEHVITKIRERQANLRHLKVVEMGYLAYWSRKHEQSYLPGCQECIWGKVTHVRHSTKCTQNCKYCYYYGQTMRPIATNRYGMSSTRRTFTAEEIRFFIRKQALGYFKAIGWLDKEPLMEIDKARPVMEYIAALGIWQYLYTNGLYANSGNLQKLKDWGLNEIRFNLAATNFAPGVIRNMEKATQYFPFVGIEMPVYKESYEGFLKKREWIVNSGISHINFAELHLNEHNVKNFPDEILYRHRGGNVSPISSREYTYNLIELAEEEGWEIFLNDCSNELKFFRDTPAGNEAVFPGNTTYGSKMFLPKSAYYYAIDNIIEDEVKIF